MSFSATTTPPSSSSDFGDSKYGEDAAPQTRLGELERDHPEVTPTTTQPEPPATREATPQLVEGYHTRSVEPLAARASQSDQRLFEELTRIFFASAASEAAPWPPEKQTWLSVARSRYLGWTLVPLPSQMAKLAERLMYIYPAGVVVFYTGKHAVHHYSTGNEVTRTTVGSAISLLRKKPGLCCLIYVRQTYVGILEVLTHPGQTQQGAEVRSVVEEAAAGLPQRGRRRRWRWQQY